MSKGKEAFARLHYRFFGGRSRPRPGGRLLLYHDVRPADASRFAAQLDFLRAEYRVLPLSEFLSALSSPESHERPALAITFDDGYRDNYEVAYPLLRRAGLSAAFFLVSSMPAETAADRDASPEPGAGGWSPRLFMTWEELQEMTRTGMEIGLHSHGHPNIAQLSTAELEADLDANLQSITRRLNVTPVAYAVPFGSSRHTHPDLGSILARRGVQHALLATHGWNDASVSPYRLHRDAIQPAYGPGYLRAILGGCFDWLG